MMQPTILDRLVLMQRDLDALKQQVTATAQVVDAVGQAVGQMYQQNQMLMQALQPNIPQPDEWTPDSNEDY